MFKFVKAISSKNIWKNKAIERRKKNKNLKKEIERLKKSRNKWKEKASKFKEQNIHLHNELKKNI
jgi:hypothetical protein